MMKVVAAVVAAGALVVGAKAIAKSDPPSSNGVAGTARPEMRPGMGSAVTGATLDRLKSVVTARYPGTIERAGKLPDGSYIVHVIRSNGHELHVHVTEDFEVSGTDQGRGDRPHDGFPPGGPPPGDPS